jgi:hypothetical protein
MRIRQAATVEIIINNAFNLVISLVDLFSITVFLYKTEKLNS